jgi:hypothetical protein
MRQRRVVLNAEDLHIVLVPESLRDVVVAMLPSAAIPVCVAGRMVIVHRIIQA